MGWITSHLWKLTTGAAVAASLGLLVALVGAKIEVRQLDKIATQRAREIGLLTGQIAHQNDMINRQAEEGKRRLAEAEAALAQARAATTRAEGRAARLLAYTPKGATTCERLLDLDAQLLEGLK